VNRQARRIPWWTPLLVPAVVLVSTALSTVSRGTHVVHSTYPTATSGGVMMALLVGLPAFVAGARYRGSAERVAAGAETHPTGSGPA
jgi:hypothetical protein